MASEILQSLVERVHLLQERPGSWADQDKMQTVTDLALELAQSLAELEDRLRRVETRPQPAAAQGARATAKTPKTKAAKPKAKASAKPKLKAAAKPKAKARPAKNAKARGRRR